MKERHDFSDAFQNFHVRENIPKVLMTGYDFSFLADDDIKTFINTFPQLAGDLKEKIIKILDIIAKN